MQRHLTSNAAMIYTSENKYKPSYMFNDPAPAALILKILPLQNHGETRRHGGGPKMLYANLEHNKMLQNTPAWPTCASYVTSIRGIINALFKCISSVNLSPWCLFKMQLSNSQLHSCLKRMEIQEGALWNQLKCYTNMVLFKEKNIYWNYL